MLSQTDLPFVIKICGIMTQEDARVAVDAGANALGFNFYTKTPRYISFRQAQEIINAVPGEYLKVGIFVEPEPGEMTAALVNVQLDVVQIYGEWRPEWKQRWSVWEAVKPGERKQFSGADAYLMDTPTSAFGGSGKAFNWMLARGRHNVIVAGGLDASNVAEAIATASPWGVDACSRLESQPGRKDADKVRAFVGAAQQAFTALLEQETHL
jgi:phosphoribosylanthranilate isomerase